MKIICSDNSNDIRIEDKNGNDITREIRPTEINIHMKGGVWPVTCDIKCIVESIEVDGIVIDAVNGRKLVPRCDSCIVSSD